MLLLLLYFFLLGRVPVLCYKAPILTFKGSTNSFGEFVLVRAHHS